MRQKLVILSGAGMSAESGFSTFRDSDGLWERYPVEQVATPEGWRADPTLVTNFYNHLRRGLVTLENQFDVTIVTQNVDDLHERAGSSHVIHLHGELMKACSSRDPDNPRLWQTLTPERVEIHPGELAADGSLLRPWIVWFGEAVPNLEQAAKEVAKADIFVIIGSSLNVYPAAGLVRHVPDGSKIFLIDPAEVRVPSNRAITVLRLPASEGVKELRRRLLPDSEI